MSRDDVDRILNKRSSEIRAPRTPAELAPAWQAIIDRPHDDHERRWFIDNWFHATERVLEGKYPPAEPGALESEPLKAAEFGAAEAAPRW